MDQLVHKVFVSSFSRFPFDWKNPVGYVFAFIVEYSIASSLFWCIGSMAIFGIESYLISVAITNDVESNLRLIIESAKSRKNHSKTMALIKEFIETYSTFKQLIKSHRILVFHDQIGFLFQLRGYCHYRIIYGFSGVCKLTTSVVFGTSLITMCGSMLMIQTEMVQYPLFVSKI